jgi:hypothetical protein
VSLGGDASPVQGTMIVLAAACDDNLSPGKDSILRNATFTMPKRRRDGRNMSSALRVCACRIESKALNIVEQ